MGGRMNRVIRHPLFAVTIVVLVLTAVVLSYLPHHTRTRLTMAQACAAAPSTCVYVAPGAPLSLGTWFDEATDDGVDEANAVSMAIGYLHNASFTGIPGTFLGHPIRVVPINDGCSATSGIVAARRLVDNNVVVAIGPSCSASVFRAGAPLLAKDHLLTISPEAGSLLLTKSPNQDRYFFRVGRNDAIQASTMADYALNQLGAHTVGVIAEADAYSLPLANAISNDIHSAGTAHVEVVVKGQDPSMAAASMAQLHPDVIFLAANNEHCSNLPRALRQVAALRSVPIVLAQACQERGVLKALAGLDAHVFVAGPDFQQELANKFYVSEFLPAYRDLFGGYPTSIYNTFAWDATNVALQAIDHAAEQLPNGALYINREALRQAMLRIQSYPGLSGEVSCASTGDCVAEARVGIYAAPSWPAAGDLSATPVFSETKVLSGALSSATLSH